MRYSLTAQSIGTEVGLTVLPDMVKPTPSPQSMADIEKQLTPEGIEAKLSQGGSTDIFDKAQQLIDQYGTAEGLGRLRESDPEAARQFEHLVSPKGQSPEQEQRERKTNTEP